MITNGATMITADGSAPELPRPLVNVDASTSMSRTAKNTTARSRRNRKFGHRERGTSHTVFIARCAACATASPAQIAASTPTATLSQLPCSSCSPAVRLNCEPITGNSPNAESTMSCRSPGCPSSTMPSTLTNTNSNGNSEKNP